MEIDALLQPDQSNETGLFSNDYMNQARQAAAASDLIELDPNEDINKQHPQTPSPILSYWIDDHLFLNTNFGYVAAGMNGDGNFKKHYISLDGQH